MGRAIVLVSLLVGGVAQAGWPDLSQLPPPGDKGGAKDAALVVSIERYAELPGIPGATKNAGDWHQYLTARGVPTERIQLLRDNEGTVEKIRKFAKLAAERVQAGGTLWFVFIGHGAPAKDGKDGLLVGYDAQQDADSLFARSIPQKELVGLLKGPQAKSVVLIDACFSGRAPGGQALVKGLQPLVLVSPVQPASLGTTLLLTAAKSDQFAGPLPGADRPAFSYLALGGLRGWADSDGDGKVTAKEVRDYTSRALTSLLKDRNQEPQLVAQRPGDVLALGNERGPDLAALQRAAPTGGTPGANSGGTPGANPGGTPTVKAAAPKGPPITVAVAAFRATGLPPDMAWLGQSFADGLITKISHAQAARIVEREFLDQIVNELKLQKSSMIDESSAVRVGKLLGAKVFVFGSVAMMGEEVVVRARTVSVEKGEVLDALEANGNKGAMFALQGDLGGKVANALALTATIVEEPPAPKVDVSVATMNDLERLRALGKGLPFFGLDPARNRKKGDFQLGLSICDRLLAANKELAPAHYYRALFSLHGEDYSMAELESENAEKLAPGDVETALLRANVLYARKDNDGSLAAYQKVAERKPDDSRAWFAAGRLLQMKGDKAGAAADYVAAIQLQPLVKDAETNLRTLIAGPEGKALVDGLAKARPDAFPSVATFRAFWDGKEAGDLAAKSIDGNPRLYIGYYMQGVAASKKGKAGEARVALERALALRPTSPEVHREMGYLLLKNRECALGKLHMGLYMHTSTYVDDFKAIEGELDKCK